MEAVSTPLPSTMNHCVLLRRRVPCDFLDEEKIESMFSLDDVWLTCNPIGANRIHITFATSIIYRVEAIVENRVAYVNEDKRSITDLHVNIFLSIDSALI